jgi:hypothetical protein
MTDIVEKLRAWHGTDDEEDFEVIKEAIDEIERLRNTISQLRAVAGAVSVEGHSYADIRANSKRAGTAGPGEPS